MFMVCQNLKKPLHFGMDFTQNYRKGINWDHDGVSYLRYKDRKLISAWPNGSISDSDHVTKEILPIIDMSVDLVTNDLGFKTEDINSSDYTTTQYHNHTIRTTAQSFTMHGWQY